MVTFTFSLYGAANVLPEVPRNETKLFLYHKPKIHKEEFLTLKMAVAGSSKTLATAGHNTR
jgi:hypothetical protein